ncbi:phosphoribosylanthranilate isomerase [Chryseolinea serpens]|uniref:N-(5'-phosphoribosyl)anthranilate isomerase n=1 Tax=Chryseolinea serpens TaxID=947013 RepID=A0A1M5JZL1_9BACT|nr:phosphoribosylanthranilate isomerase [Chryseolinea serpens]SHG45699.1 phosphoribosylanthranilate isomerase [Chryseolinea serpens]
MAPYTDIKLKICGMRDGENIREVAALSPQYMGFIFYRKSPRFVGDDFVMPAIPASIKKVGVFVNETTETILNLASRYDLTLIQLHGNETPEQCRELKAKGLGVIKVFSMGEDFDWSVVQPYKPVADFFLFDTKGKYYGGNAQAFDWSLLQQYDQEIPFFLSGGLSPENIGNITGLKDMNLYALDVNSGVEDSPGVKNISKIEFVLEKLKSLSDLNLKA